MEKPRDWKQQFLEVKKIGEEPALNKDGFWKKFEPVRVELEGTKRKDGHKPH
jgi:hypothetical protein